MHHVGAQHAIEIFLIQAHLGVHQCCVVACKSIFDLGSRKLLARHHARIACCGRASACSCSSSLIQQFVAIFACILASIVGHKMPQI